jgi:hypothetical protein
LKEKNMFRLVLFALLISSYSFGQLVNGGGGHFYIGNAWVNQPHMGELVSAPSSQFSSLLVGGGGHGVFNGFLLGGEGGALLSGNVTDGTYTAKQITGFGMINLGYMHPIKESMLFYPLIGIGNSTTYLDYNDETGQIGRYQTNGLLMKVELNLDLFAFFKESGSQRYGFKTGLSIGYVMNPSPNDWSTASGQDMYIPQNRLEGLYVKLKFGGGGFQVK